MRSFLNFYIFLWKNKSIFFFFMLLIPLTSFFYLQKQQSKQSAVIQVRDYDLTHFKDNYPQAKIEIKDNIIYITALSKKQLQSVSNDIIGDISYSTLKELKQDLKTRSLKVASLLEKKKAFVKLKAKNQLTEDEKLVYDDEVKVVDNLYKTELLAFEQADIDYKSYSLDKNIKLTYLEGNKYTFEFKFMLSILVAFLVACLVGYLRGLLNNSFDDELEIKKATSIKAMEGFPRFKKMEVINNVLKANSLKVYSLTEISRIFKYISTRDRKVFEVVSSVKNEGNSSLVYALAQHAAEHGHKVLVLDMNLKNMELSIKVTKSIESWDIADGDFKKLEEKTVNLTKNLDFLPAFKDRQSLEYLKVTKNLKALMKYLKENYDYVFVDTTAVFSVNINNIDSVILAEAVDGVLVNYLANRTKKKILLETIEKINLAESNILGIVTNNRYNPKLKDELLTFCSYLEKLNKGLADNLRLRILKSYLLDEE